MKRNLLLFLLCFSVIFACRRTNQPNQQMNVDLSLKELKIAGRSILNQMDETGFYNYGEIEKYSILVEASAKSNNVMVTVGTDHAQGEGLQPYFTCYLQDNINLVKVTTSLKTDPSKEKVYTIKLKKTKANLEDIASSKLKELKVDGVSIVNKLEDNNNVYNFGTVAKTKENVKLSILPHNPEAEIEVANGNNSVDEIKKREYEVTISSGSNNIQILVTSQGEGSKLHTVKIYKEEDLRLESFKIDEKEYCDPNTGIISQKFISFPKDKENVKIKVEAKDSDMTVIFKYNGEKVQGHNGVYNLNLGVGSNRVEVTVMGNGGSEYSKTQSVTLFRIPSNTNTSGLEILKADDKDILPLLSDDNSITLPAVHNEKETIKLEAKKTGATISCELDGSQIPLSNGFYNINLQEGKNTIKVKLSEDSAIPSTYTIFLTRYPKVEEPKTPEADELIVEFIISDGVNGSPVDGTYLSVFKTKESNPLKKLLVKNGKAKITLKKDTFYDFKLEGLNDEFATTRYAASDIISYYVSDNRKIISMVQPLLARVNRPAIAPVIEEFKFGSNIIEQGTVTDTASKMEDVSIKLLTCSSIIEYLDDGYPLPMLAIGFVPTTIEAEENIDLIANKISSPKKNAEGKYNSSWKWYLHTQFINGDAFDVVVVAYDVAANRVEYHARFKASNTTETEEDSTIKIENIKMDFERQPTPSTSLYSVGQDEETGNSTHYKNVLSFDVKKSGTHLSCKGFNLYRKCVSSDEDYRIVKHLVYTSASSSSSKPHKIADTDGVLEDEKTYKYKIVAFTTDGKKSSLDSSNEIEITVPKSTVVLLTYPYDIALSKTESNNFDYKFKFSNSKILKNAKSLKMGLLISDRQGSVFYASKFRYVFNKGGNPKLYFAQRGDEKIYQYFYVGTNYSVDVATKTTKKLDQLIVVDEENGTVTLKKDLVDLRFSNIASYTHNVSYKPGEAYYWDIVDFGKEPYTDYDDIPCVIEFEEKNGVRLNVPCNNRDSGNNAWNGRGEFTVRWD